MTPVFVSAALTSLVGMTIIMPCIRMLGVMDVPNSRSSHVAPTPRGGGLAVAIAIALATAVGFGRGLPSNGWVLGGIILIGCLGFADDLAGLGVSVRLMTQAIVASGVSISLMWRSPYPSPMNAAVAVAAGMVWLVGYTNAFNFMDGVNGIAALNAALAGVWFLYVGLSHELNGIAVLGAAVAGGAMGFLPWNVPRARVFLGDVGSYTLGFAISSLALWAWTAGVPVLMAVAPLMIYLADTGWTLMRRVLGGRPWREGHREHIYQRLADLGLGHMGSAATCAAASALICGWAYATDRVVTADEWLVLGPALVVTTYLLLPTLLATFLRSTAPRLRNLAGPHRRDEA
jgi:UDP-GlcNAc:undecaprenyl-phosphate GlcNAc-1-phosphate transferase